MHTTVVCTFHFASLPHLTADLRQPSCLFPPDDDVTWDCSRTSLCPFTTPAVCPALIIFIRLFVDSNLTHCLLSFLQFIYCISLSHNLLLSCFQPQRCDMRFLPFRSRSQVTQQTSELGRSWWEDSTKNSSEIAWSEADSLPPPPPPLPPTPTISHSATQSPNVARVKVCVVDSTNEEHAGRGNGYSSSEYCSDEVDENDDIYEGADGSEDDTVLRWKKSVEMLVAQVSTEEFFDADLGSVMVGTSSEEKG